MKIFPMFKSILLKTTEKNSRAFTLIELSMVIVIIGILIAGVMTATTLVKKSKIAAAQSLTNASPISGIQDNTLWLESGLESSFKDGETSTGDAVTTWYDQKSSVNKSSVVAVGTGPIYSNTINYIHAVKFNGSTANYLQVTDASFLNKSDYTIFVLEKRQSANSNNYFLGDSTQNSLLLGYTSDNNVIHSRSGTTVANDLVSGVDSYANSNDKPRIFAFSFNTSSGSKTYINGTLSAQNTTNLTPLDGVSSLSIGKGYSGEIGEIVAFGRSLKNEERKSVEDYLSKKWSVKLTRDLVASCIDGVITENGCKASCPVSVVGVIATTFVDGFSGSLTCNATGYAGGTTTQTYTCLNGSLNPAPANVCITSGATSSGATVCATNYELVGSACQAVSCSVPTNVGTNETTVNQSSGTIPCNKSGFDSGTSAAYTCSNGIFAISGTPCLAAAKCRCSVGACTTDKTSIPGEVILRFTTSGELTCDQDVTAKILVVAGGGGGGSENNDTGAGGGGGGGGVVRALSYTITAGVKTITVGAGGDRAGRDPSNPGAPTGGKRGGDSSFPGLTAKGGGGGMSYKLNEKNGGSGGGGYWASTETGTNTDSEIIITPGFATQDSPSGATGYGSNGGRGAGGNCCATGGGGGAGGPGGTASISGTINSANSISSGGAGGPGIFFSDPDNYDKDMFTGLSTLSYYGAGGGGAAVANSTTNNNAIFNYGSGGSSVGGNGASKYNKNATDGAANTGSGGGGGVGTDSNGIQQYNIGKGGSGIVIVRYRN